MTSVLHSQLRKEATAASLIPTLKFVGIGVLWIVISDLALFLTQRSLSTHFPLFHIEILKGILFVFAMGAFFFLMQRKNDVMNRELVELDLFKKNPQAMFIYNLRTMEFLDVNEAAISTYGYSRAEFLSMKICDIRPKEELPTLMKAIEQLQNGHRLVGNSRHIRKDGTILHTEVSAFSIIFNQEHAGLIMSNDISNQVKAERALIEATKLHEKQMHDKLYEVALFNKELQVRIREINATNDDLIEVNKLLQQASRKSIARYEARIHRTQDALHESLSHVNTIFWIIDLHDNDATLITEGALSFYGCSRKCVFDKPNFWETFIHADDKTHVQNQLLQLNATNKIAFEYRHVDGATRIFQEIRFVRDEDERVEKIVFNVTPTPTPKSPKGDLK